VSSARAIVCHAKKEKLILYIAGAESKRELGWAAGAGDAWLGWSGGLVGGWVGGSLPAWLQRQPARQAHI
jgi:hypothetical protein